MHDAPLSHRITHRHIEVFRAVMTTGSATGAEALDVAVGDAVGQGRIVHGVSISILNG